MKQNKSRTFRWLFPHIFSLVIKYNGRKTLKRLRSAEYILRWYSHKKLRLPEAETIEDYLNELHNTALRITNKILFWEK